MEDNCEMACCKGGANHNKQPVAEQDLTVIVRSTIACKGICCPSEIPQLLEILNPIQGVMNVEIDVPHKLIHVDHNSDIVSAAQIVQRLNDEKFESTILTDGASKKTLRSTFERKGICRPSEVPELLGILNSIDGVENVEIHVPRKLIMVDHQVSMVSAPRIAEILEDTMFDSTIVCDGSNIKKGNNHEHNDHKNEEKHDCGDHHDHKGHDHDHKKEEENNDCGHDHNYKKAHNHGHDHKKEKNDDCERAKDVGVRGRSQFHVKGICCASELPAVRSIMEAMEGVTDHTVNLTTKTLTVHHYANIVTVQDICDALEAGGFGATVKHDYSKLQANKSGPGRSRFHVTGICCASELPAVRSIMEATKGVSGHTVNLTTKTVYVNHDAGIVTVQDICDALEAGGFGATVEQDYSKEVGAVSAFVTSRFAIEATSTSPTEQLSGLEKALKACLDSLYEERNIEAVTVNIKTMTASIVHNAFAVRAEDIATSVSEKAKQRQSSLSSMSMSSQRRKSWIADVVAGNTALEGVTLKLQVDGNAEKDWEFPEYLSQTEEDTPEDNQKKGPFNVSLQQAILVVSGICWIVSMFELLLYPLNYVGIVTIVLTFPQIAIKAYKAMKSCRIDVNILMAIAMVGACALQEFSDAAAVGFLFSISDLLESLTSSRARSALKAIISLKPDSANLIHPQTREIVIVPAEAVPKGALVAVKSGDKIPCDGIVTQGSSSVDESSLTGESRPIQKNPGDLVSGGTVNSGNAQLVVQTTSDSEDSAVSRLIKLVEEAQANPSKTEQLVNKVAAIYTPIILIAAFFMLTIPWYKGVAVGEEWAMTALVLIVAACPCALIISTPVSYVAGLAATARNGVLIKGGAYLEALAAVKQIYLDKTGTLTQGEFKMLHLDVIGDHLLTRKEILEYLYLMEERASHPLSIALANGAKNEGIATPNDLLDLTDHTFLPGEGVTGTVDDRKVYVGNERLFRRLGLYENLQESEKEKVKQWESIGGTIGFMSIEGEGIVCSYCAADEVRPEAKSAVAELQSMGIDVAMITGDHRDTALAIGKAVGLKDEAIRSELLPEEKLEIVSQAAKTKTVLMCGDGVNDAPALAAAHVGVAMGEGAALAMETADATLLSSSMTKLVYSVQMGRKVKNKILQNVLFSITVKVIVIVFTLMHKVNLGVAIATDLGGMLVVTLNGMLLLPFQRKERKGEEKKNSRLEESVKTHESIQSLEFYQMRELSLKV